MEKDEGKYLFKRLRFCFRTSLLGFLAIILSIVIKEKYGITGVNIVEIVTFIPLLSAFAFLNYLGRLASNLNKNKIAWVGLTILTGPFGLVGAYLMMKTSAIEKGWL